MTNIDGHSPELWCDNLGPYDRTAEIEIVLQLRAVAHVLRVGQRRGRGREWMARRNACHWPDKDRRVIRINRRIIDNRDMRITLRGHECLERCDAEHLLETDYIGVQLRDHIGHPCLFVCPLVGFIIVRFLAFIPIGARFGELIQIPCCHLEVRHRKSFQTSKNKMPATKNGAAQHNLNKSSRILEIGLGQGHCRLKEWFGAVDLNQAFAVDLPEPIPHGAHETAVMADQKACRAVQH